MVDVELVNMKIDYKKSNDNIFIYKPTIQNANKYNIIFKSINKIFIQFNLYVRFTNFVEIISNESTTKFDIFPLNGIFYTCYIDSSSNLTINIKPLDLCAKILITKKIIYIYKNINFKVIWNNIFIINLPRRIDRKNDMIQKLKKANITQYQFINAFDGQDPKILSKFNKLKQQKNFPFVTAGHFACLLSHINVIKLAIKNNYDNIMILEDDIIFKDNFISELEELVIPDYDFIYLGGIISKKKLFYTNWAYSNNNKIMGAYGYILPKKMYIVILNILSKLEDYVDILYIKEFQSNYKTIILNDFVKTNLNSTDTSCKAKKLVKRLNYIE